MSQRNPFQVIRSTDQPPESLRKDVMGSVKMLMLIMRFAQLFMADYGNLLFDKVRLLGSKPKGTTPGDSSKDS
ncbi:MAG: hypothetical protein IPG74_17925 [Flavobacteriales bacterium]|nr:hypothetical protein [Flavobacteriales bacterium]MBK7555640.1 hypothetical protein [Flavobacteriales bacterium]MBK9195321.1 hypothetical protein [Flavobacteriales bacterium]